MIGQPLPLPHIHPINISPTLLDQKPHHRHPLSLVLLSSERRALNSAMQRAPTKLCAMLTQLLQRGYGALARNGFKQRRSDKGVQIGGISDVSTVRDTPSNQFLIIADETEEALAASERGTGCYKTTLGSSSFAKLKKKKRSVLKHPKTNNSKKRKKKKERDNQLTHSPP